MVSLKEFARTIASELGMEWCALFPHDRFPHLFLYWEEVKTNE